MPFPREQIAVLTAFPRREEKIHLVGVGSDERGHLSGGLGGVHHGAQFLIKLLHFLRSGIPTLLIVLFPFSIRLIVVGIARLMIPVVVGHCECCT